MNPTPIRAVLFDMGGTLEDVYFDDELRLDATPGFRDVLARHGIDTSLDAPSLYSVIRSGMDKYRKQREETERELAPERLWSDLVFCSQHWPEDKLAAAGEELAFYWDTRFSRRQVRPEAPLLLDMLRRRGLHLGVISNITSREFVRHQLEEYRISSYFDAVVTSAEFGWRKPNPCIFLEAARLVGVPPAECAYVGDTVSRDVRGARRAGYAMVIQIKSFLTTQADTDKDTEPPDIVIMDLLQVADVIANGRQG